jgi:hypothetical protein
MLAGHSEEASRSIGESAQVYFTTKTDGKALLAVIPDKRIAAYVWRD